MRINEKFEPDEEMSRHVASYATEFNAKLSHTIGYTSVEIEGRFRQIRARETNLTSFVSDLVRTEWP